MIATWFEDEAFTLHVGNVETVLAEMEPASVQTVVTSPPYWGLRDYGTATWVGGDAECDHRRWPGAATGNKGGVASIPMLGTCERCGASRVDDQLGLEPTPEQYVERLVGVFREIRRVLSNDGTVWLNLGDSFRNKNLVGTPWRCALALQADGWYLRSDIIWSKANPMPESITDRPTKSHEYLFLLSKNARYYYDAAAIAEPDIGGKAGNVRARPNPAAKLGGGDTRHGLPFVAKGTRNKRTVWETTLEPFPGAHFATFPQKLITPCVLAGCPPGGLVLDPFIGSGTTAIVARSTGRRAVGIELNPEYADIAVRRYTTRLVYR